MQKLQGPCDLNRMYFKYAEEMLFGKWFHFSRVYIVKADESLYAISLNIFERIAAFFARLIGKNYLATKLQAKTAEICYKTAILLLKTKFDVISLLQKPGPIPSSCAAD